MTLLFLYATQAFDLRVHLSARPPIVFNAMEERTEGSSHTTLGTHFEVQPSSATSVSVSTGPYNSQGRTFGHKKTHVATLTPQGTVAGDNFKRPPFMLSVPLPGRAVKAGETWSGVVVGPTPMPAGVTATFKVLGSTNIAGASCARIGTKINWEQGGTKVTGDGEFSVSLADGLVEKGGLSVVVEFRRPDPVTHVMKVNATAKVKASIARS